MNATAIARARRAASGGLVAGTERTPAQVHELPRLAGKMKANPNRHRSVLDGRSVTEEAMNSARSIAYEQAENRLHVAKAALTRPAG